MEVQYSIDLSTVSEIEEMLGDIDGIEVKDISNPKSTGLRQPQNMEPFTYFVVVFAAHLAAGITHDILKKTVSERLAKKNPKEK